MIFLVVGRHTFPDFFGFSAQVNLKLIGYLASAEA